MNPYYQQQPSYVYQHQTQQPPQMNPQMAPQQYPYPQMMYPQQNQLNI